MFHAHKCFETPHATQKQGSVFILAPFEIKKTLAFACTEKTQQVTGDASSAGRRALVVSVSHAGDEVKPMSLSAAIDISPELDVGDAVVAINDGPGPLASTVLIHQIKQAGATKKVRTASFFSPLPPSPPSICLDFTLLVQILPFRISDSGSHSGHPPPLPPTKVHASTQVHVLIFTGWRDGWGGGSYIRGLLQGAAPRRSTAPRI